MINKVPRAELVFNRRKTASATRKASVEIRVTHEGKQKYISTGVSLLKHQWKKGRVTDCPGYAQLNLHLDSLLSDVRKVIYDMAVEDCMDIYAIPERLDSLHTVKMTFIDFCQERARVRKYGITKGSQLRYDRFIRLFSEWGKIKEFRDISESSVIDYDTYLTDKGMHPYSKWNNYHRFLKSFISDAVREGHLKKNPYSWIKIDKRQDTSTQRHLTPEEFHMLKSVILPTESLERVRDLFVFQTYTCLSYSDLKEFNPEAIQEVKGMKVYAGKRHKTGEEFTIPLLKPALDILVKYSWKLPVISNVKYNEYLKVVAQAAGIDRPVSTHWARHTGATMLLNEGIDMTVVARICGHSSTRITEKTYAKLLDETVVMAVKDKDIK